MSALTLFLPCAKGVEPFLQKEVESITGKPAVVLRSGIRLVKAQWQDVLQLNLQARLTQRVLIEIAHGPYHQEQDLYAAAYQCAWEQWFGVDKTFKVDITAKQCPLKSLHFAALKIKDGIADRFRQKKGQRPNVETHYPHVRIFVHLEHNTFTLYLDSSGEALFKRGWRQQQGDAPLKETLAAAMIAATYLEMPSGTPLYDPCCGSGTIAIEAAQMACHIPAGLYRRFAFEHLNAYDALQWKQLKEQAKASILSYAEPFIFASDISHRMVDFAQKNAKAAGLGHVLHIRAGDVLQRTPPIALPGVLLINPPYGERIEAAGVAGRSYRDRMQTTAHDEDVEMSAFFESLAAHWKTHFGGWTAWVLSPDRQLPQKMRLRETRKIPMWNGPIECRLWRFDITARVLSSSLSEASPAKPSKP